MTSVPLPQVGRDNPPPVDIDLDSGALDENAYRLIKYEFSEDVLRLPSIQVMLRCAGGSCRGYRRGYRRTRLKSGGHSFVCPRNAI